MDVRAEQLEITVAEGEGCARISLRGALDVATAGRLAERLATVNRSGVTGVVVDLSELTYIDAAGLSPLVAEQQRATASGISMRIASPTAFVREVLTFTGLTDFFRVSPEGEAV